MIIDEIVFSNHGFNAEMANGLILSKEPLLVKTSNGVVELTVVRNENFKIKVGLKLI